MSIHVLIVADGEGSFCDPLEHRFSLMELVKALKGGGYAVTTAHRSPSEGDQFSAQAGTADLPGFEITGKLPYDEVWLMGFASSNKDGPYKHQSHPFLQSELDALITFMNAGGGVFATGDHDDLGYDLCGAVPRVATMRRWRTNYKQYDPTLSPPPFGRHRIDTTRRGNDTHYEFQDQSDDVPKIISPVVTYHHKIVDGKTVLYAVAHPLLMVPKTDKIISVMPDHMHEGMCQLPADPARKYKLGDKMLDEYPVKDGVRVLPEVVARGVVKARKKEQGFEDPDFRDANEDVDAAVFPLIVAYHGQLAGVGNVVTDSTFHHFVNINVTGVKPGFEHEPDPDIKTDPARANGFLSSPVGQAHYERIKTYWRNIARWIARPGAE